MTVVFARDSEVAKTVIETEFQGEISSRELVRNDELICVEKITGDHRAITCETFIWAHPDAWDQVRDLLVDRTGYTVYFAAGCFDIACKLFKMVSNQDLGEWSGIKDCLSEGSPSLLQFKSYYGFKSAMGMTILNNFSKCAR